METIDPDVPPKIEPCLVFEKHDQKCRAYITGRTVPGHPVNRQICTCGYFPKPEAMKLSCRIKVRGSSDVSLEAPSICEYGEPRLNLYVCDYDGITDLTVNAARVIAQKLLAWANSVEEVEKAK